MADVQAVFGTLLALGIIFPGMLIAWWLMFPRMVGNAGARIEQTPGRSLALGVALALPIGVIAVILSSFNAGPANFLGGALVVGSLAFASIGASAMASVMGRRLSLHSSEGTSEAATFLRGAIALELAAAFPVIGWFLVIPVITLTSFGAATFAAFGWMPRPTAEAPSQALSQA